jgi:hypothetical protein
MERQVMKTLSEFSASAREHVSTRWIIRALTLDAKGRILKKIEESLRDINTDDDGKVDEEAVKDALAKVNVIAETVPDGKHLNPVIDLFADIGIMELDRYDKGCYQGAATPEFKETVAALLRTSTTNLANLTGSNVEDMLKKIFSGNIVLMIKATDWKSIDEWKRNNDAVLKSL